MTTSNSDYTNGQTKIDKPHDKLVRRLLSNITAAREILEAFLHNPTFCTVSFHGCC